MNLEETEKKTTKNRKKLMIICGGCGIILFLFVCLFVFKTYNKQNDVNIKDTSSNTEIKESEKEKTKYFTVTFNSTGGTTIQSQTIEKNKKVIQPDNPTRNEYKFIEWQLNGETYDFNTEITQDIELLAIWEKENQINNNFNNVGNENNYTNNDYNNTTNENNSVNNEIQYNTISYNELGAWYKDNNGLSVRLDTYTKEETEGYISYKISYTLKNEVPDSKIIEGSFKLFFTDNTGEPQYGGFDYMYYGDEVNRSYEWKVLKNQQVYVLEYNADEPDAGLNGAFFRNTPISTSLHWRTP